MVLIERENISLRKRWLSIKNEESLSENTSFLIPFGCGFDIKKHQLYLKVSDSKTYLFTKINNKQVQLYPNYQAYDIIEKDGNSIKVKIWQVNSDIDWMNGQSIISNTHYLNATAKGMMLACSIDDPIAEEQIIKASKEIAVEKHQSHNNFHSQGDMIGCALLDTLIFGNPKGRSEFAVSLLGPNWDQLKRNIIVDKLSLAWGSRFAIKPPFQGYGLGTLLAKHMKILAKGFRIPPSERLEIIRTVTKEKAQKIINGEESDFLIQAGFKVYPIASYTQPLWEMDYNSGSKMPPSKAVDRKIYRKLYYYTSL